MKIAIISDTHGLIRPEVIGLLKGADAIVHAGDVGGAEVLDAFTRIAPTCAVRGNTDEGSFGRSLPENELLTFDGASLYVVHRIDDLDLDPATEGIRLVVFGHSHKPETYRQNGVGYLNPGSIGPRRFSLPVSFAWLTWSADAFDHQFVDVEA